MKQSAAKWVVFLLLVLLVAGCGETIQGIGKDTLRMVRGVKTIFVSGN